MLYNGLEKNFQSQKTHQIVYEELERTASLPKSIAHLMEDSLTNIHSIRINTPKKLEDELTSPIQRKEGRWLALGGVMLASIGAVMSVASYVNLRDLNRN